MTEFDEGLDNVRIEFRALRSAGYGGLVFGLAIRGLREAEELMRPRGLLSVDAAHKSFSAFANRMYTNFYHRGTAVDLGSLLSADGGAGVERCGCRQPPLGGLHRPPDRDCVLVVRGDGRSAG